MTELQDIAVDRQIAALLSEGTAPSTRRANARDQRYFDAWRAIAFPDVPLEALDEAVILTFILHHVETRPEALVTALTAQGWRVSAEELSVRTVRRYLASVSVWLDSRGWSNPCRGPRVRLLLKKVARIQAGRAKPKAALTRDRLDQLLATCDASLAGHRDRALLLIGYGSGGRRRSELADMRLEALRPDGAGYVIHLPRDKTHQQGEGRIWPIRGQAAEALRVWLDKSGLTHGALFRQITRHGHMGGPLSGQGINRMVKRRAKQAGLDPAMFGAHSLRSGFMTDCARGGIVLGDAMQLSGHRSAQVAQSYYRVSELAANPAIRLVDQ